MIQNWISHLNGYREYRKRVPLNSNEIALYYILMEYCNELGWMDWFRVSNGVVQGLSDLSRSAFHRARNELGRKGYIKYKDGIGNNAGCYLLVDFGTQTGTQSGTQTGTQTEHKVEPLNKLKTKTETITPSNPPFEKIIEAYCSICVSYPAIRKLSDARKKAIRARLASGYSFEDFVELFEKAEQSSFLKGGNTRNWSASFDWLIADKNMAKVLDGNYSDKSPQQTPVKSAIDWSGFDD